MDEDVKLPVRVVPAKEKASTIIALSVVIVSTAAAIVALVYFGMQRDNTELLSARLEGKGAKYVARDGNCVFPFFYDDKEYMECTNEKAAFRWCSLSARFNGTWSQCIAILSANSRCAFPFTYKGEVYYGCTRDSSISDYWCSFTTYYEGEWDYCSVGSPPASVKTSHACHMPFDYEGHRYNTCTKEGSEHYWCATAKEYSPAKWTYCDDTTIRLHSKCHIPFVYKDHNYTACTLHDLGEYWCSTTPQYEGHWQRCGLLADNGHWL